MPYFLGLDLGGTNIKSAVVNDQGRVLSKASAATAGDQGADAVIDRMAVLASAVVAEAGLNMDRIDAVGVGSPGPIDFDRGLVVAAPNLPRFKDVPIRDRMAQVTGRPAVLENDANAAALGEYWVGAGRDPSIRHMVVLTLGTGVGSGLIVDGRIVHGGAGFGGEAGHVIMVSNGVRCGCGQRGCLEAYASASSTARRATEAIEAGQQSVLGQTHLSQGRAITARDVFDAARAGDELAGRIAGETATYLGIACVSLCRLLDPQMIVLAGGMIQAGDDLLAGVQDAWTRHDWHISQSTVRIVLSELGHDAGVIGAAAVAWDACATGRLV